VPISVDETGDLQKAITDGFVGKALNVPTRYQQLGIDTNVSLLWIYRAATIYTMVGPLSYTSRIGRLAHEKSHPQFKMRNSRMANHLYRLREKGVDIQ
jgi:hypothetical protein